MKYVEHLFILASNSTGYVSIHDFASYVGISVGITSSAVGLKICVITATIKMYKSISNKKRKRHNKIGFLAKTKLNKIEVQISNAFNDSSFFKNMLVKLNSFQQIMC